MKIEINEAKIEELGALGLTDHEIENLLESPQKDWPLSYPSKLRKGRARLAHGLRKAQISAALKGNSTMLVWLGKVYLNQKDNQSLEINAEHKAISITPNVLERLQTSYKLTMEQIRARGSLEGAPGGAARGVPGDRDGLSKTIPLSTNSADGLGDISA